jgi:glycosyltransferase involved in cell wall biosynthesis
VGISVCIICKNEARIIDSTLKQSSKIADELIIVDSGSTDSTLEIAKKYTNKVIHHDWKGFARQKNFAISLCQHSWILSLDADEVLSDALIQEIKNLNLDDKSGPNAWKIARKLFVGDKFIRWGGYYPDYQLRLFKRGDYLFAEKPVHESLVPVQNFSSCAFLKHPLHHYAYESLDDMKSNYMNYASLANAELNSKQKGQIKALAKYFYTLVYKLTARFGVLHGLLGLKLALIHAEYSYQKYKPENLRTGFPVLQAQRQKY